MLAVQLDGSWLWLAAWLASPATSHHVRISAAFEWTRHTAVTELVPFWSIPVQSFLGTGPFRSGPKNNPFRFKLFCSGPKNNPSRSKPFRYE